MTSAVVWIVWATRQASSVSGYVVTAVEHYRQSMTLDEWLDQVDAELGPPSAEAFARIDAQLGLDESPWRKLA